MAVGSRWATSDGSVVGQAQLRRKHPRLYDFVWNGCVGHEDELLIGILICTFVALFVTAPKSQQMAASQPARGSVFLVAVRPIPSNFSRRDIGYSRARSFEVLAC